MSVLRVIGLSALFFGLAIPVVGALGLPISVDLFILALLVGVSKLSIKVLYSNLALLLISIIIIIEVPMRLMIKPLPFYRPQDQFSEVKILGGSDYQRRYLPNIKSNFYSPHGDLVAIGGIQTFQNHKHLVQPRTLHFETDEYGYRNSPGSAPNADLILIGDSFVDGAGLDQSDTLSRKITSLLGINAYSLAFPDNPSGYVRRLRESEAWLRPALPKIIFLFSGNDFDFPEDVVPASTRRESKVYSLLVRQLRAKSAYTRFLYQRLGLKGPSLLNNMLTGLVTRAGSQAQKVPEVSIEPEGIGEFDVALYAPYLSRAKTPLPEKATIQMFLSEEQKATIRCVVLIPSKEQLYLALSSKLGPGNPLLQVVTRDVSLATSTTKIDLLPIFLNAVREKPSLELYLSDDTHWTPHAVYLTVEHLKAQGCLSVID